LLCPCCQRAPCCNSMKFTLSEVWTHGWVSARGALTERRVPEIRPALWKGGSLLCVCRADGVDDGGAQHNNNSTHLRHDRPRTIDQSLQPRDTKYGSRSVRSARRWRWGGGEVGRIISLTVTVHTGALVFISAFGRGLPWGDKAGSDCAPRAKRTWAQVFTHTQSWLGEH
jgi:hypothetical protein